MDAFVYRHPSVRTSCQRVPKRFNTDLDEVRGV
jgi:hypothetical protein